jgi:serine/threonine protein kinase
MPSNNSSFGVGSRSRLGGRGYKVVALLGEGRISKVFELLGSGADRLVAKVLRRSMSSDPEARAELVHEAEILGARLHTNLPRLVDARRLRAASPFFVMDMARGAPGRRLRRLVAGLPPPRAAYVAFQVLAGLGALHDAGFAHGNVGLEQLMIERSTMRADRVTILGFSRARAATPEAVQVDLRDLGRLITELLPDRARDELLERLLERVAVGAFEHAAELQAELAPWAGSYARAFVSPFAVSAAPGPLQGRPAQRPL